MPGWPNSTTYDMYSGLINITNSSKSIHYMLIESQKNKSADPLIIWFSGGGQYNDGVCSSMFGLLLESGPFVLENGEI